MVAGYCFGDSTCGQRSAYEMGMTGIPVINVNNNCATGSTAIYVARGFIAGGIAGCVLALGFEKMNPGSLGPVSDDRENPVEKHFMKMGDIAGMNAAPPMAQVVYFLSHCLQIWPGLAMRASHERHKDGRTRFLSDVFARVLPPSDVWQRCQGAHGASRHDPDPPRKDR